ncbi:MAG: hypothetical protein ACTIJQ_10010, partial [Alcaligenes sp.]
YAPVPLAGDRYGRVLNSWGDSSPGRATSAPLKQQDAYTPSQSPTGGKYSESLLPPQDHTETAGLVRAK